jgi:phosphomannomutase
MNRVIVRMAAAALGRTLLRDGTAGRGAVVGFDARHKSDVFASDTARVLAALGIEAWLLDTRSPTPILAFAVRHLGCAAGVMVTASHNPPADNGYKVYWGDGAQIVPPVDRTIEAEIEAGGLIGDDALAPEDDARIVRIDTAAVVRDYLAATLGPPRRPAGRSPVTVYTALHGVGAGIVAEAFAHVGLTPPVAVPEQCEPDPDFPTVAFPNPEEPGAMDLVLDLAAAQAADLVLANDPDADRLAVAVPRPGSGGYVQLTGDEVGALLGDHRLRHTTGRNRLVVNSLVSSSLLGRMCEAAGVTHRDTLTGFKWIMSAAAGLPDHELVFAYEEALGYAVSPAVRDKDGITAAVAMTEMVMELAADGRTVLDRLDELAAVHGLHLTAQVSPRFDDDRDRLPATIARLRAAPPTELAGSAVVEHQDFLDHDPPADLIRWRTADGDRVIVRPSGTEPKLKCYLEVTVLGSDGIEAARDTGEKRLAELSGAVSDLLEA